jgi:sigma-B regulation protein RsbU (phosphoserine phosphatase)
MLKRQPVEEAVGALNRALSQDNAPCMFVTLAVLVINRFNGEVRYVSAGHNPPALGVGGVDFAFVSPPSGILLGIEESARYEAARFTLAEDDVLVLYTDGVTEAMNAEKELFAEPRLLDCLNDSPATSSSELATRLTDSVAEFSSGAPQSDDMTLVIVRRGRGEATSPHPA